MTHQFIANSFVLQYYGLLLEHPECMDKFYHESSTLAWPGPGGVVTTLERIKAKILSSDLKGWEIEFIAKNFLESPKGAPKGGLMLLVTGRLKKDKESKNFCQIFFLASQGRGFYILFDVLEFCTDTLERSVYIGKIPRGTTEQDIVEAVKEFGEVAKVETRRDNEHSYGLVEFKSEDAARRALKACKVLSWGESYIRPRKANKRSSG